MKQRQPKASVTHNSDTSAEEQRNQESYIHGIHLLIADVRRQPQHVDARTWEQKLRCEVKQKCTVLCKKMRGPTVKTRDTMLPTSNKAILVKTTENS
jgi:hypothetical protein